MKSIDIIEFRKSQNLTQEELGEILGVDRRTIINYEQGKKIPATRIKILEYLIENGIDPKEKGNREIIMGDVEDLRREILDHKDHINTLKKLIEEKDKLSEILQAENALLKQQIDALINKK